MQNHPYSVLVIDDDPNVRDILSDLLKRERCVVRTAASGLSGIAAAHEALPDLILLDVMMPDLDGFSVCRMLRDDPQTAEVPIIMITALDDRASRLEGVKAGADEFLSKPVELSELRLRVRTMQRINRYRRLIEERERAAAHERQLTEQAKQAAQAIAEAYDQTLIGWSRALDLRDKETEGHSQRVAQLTIEIAKALNIPPKSRSICGAARCCTILAKLACPTPFCTNPARSPPKNGISCAAIPRMRMSCFHRSPICAQPSIFLTAIMKVGRHRLPAWFARRADSASSADLRVGRRVGCAYKRPALPQSVDARASLPVYSRADGQAFRSKSG